MSTFSSLTAAALREAATIKDQIEALGSRLSTLLTGDATSTPAAKASGSRKGRRTMSAAGRAKIAAAQRARWATRFKKEVKAPAASPKAERAAGTPGKRTMSPEAREKIAAAQRERWARQKGTSSTATKAVSKRSSAPKKTGGGLTPEGRAKLAAAMKARWAARKKGGSAPNAPGRAATAAKSSKTTTVYR